VPDGRAASVCSLLPPIGSRSAGPASTAGTAPVTHRRLRGKQADFMVRTAFIRVHSVGTAGTAIPPRRRLKGKRAVFSARPGQKVAERFSWVCKLCDKQYVRTDPRKIQSIKASHLYMKHRRDPRVKEIPTLYIARQNVLDPTVFSDTDAHLATGIPMEVRTWSCPMPGCDVATAAPLVTQPVRTRLLQHHWSKAHKDELEYESFSNKSIGFNHPATSKAQTLSRMEAMWKERTVSTWHDRQINGHHFKVVELGSAIWGKEQNKSPAGRTHLNGAPSRQRTCIHCFGVWPMCVNGEKVAEFRCKGLADGGLFWRTETHLWKWHHTTEADRTALKELWDQGRTPMSPQQWEALSKAADLVAQTRAATEEQQVQVLVKRTVETVNGLSGGAFTKKAEAAAAPHEAGELTLATANVSSWHEHSRALLNAVVQHQCDVVMLQECRLTQMQLITQQSTLRQSRFTLHKGTLAEEAGTRLHPAARECVGGLCFLVHNDCQFRLIDSTRMAGGEAAIGVVTAGSSTFIVGNIHRRSASSDAEKLALEEWIEQTLAAWPSEHTAFVAGDFNEVPHKLDMEGMCGGSFRAVASARPTRRQGRRVIDYFLARAQEGISLCARTSDVPIADHYLVYMSIPAGAHAHERGKQWDKPRPYRAPDEDQAREEWTARVADSWRTDTDAAFTTTEEWWASWTRRAEGALRSASDTPSSKGWKHQSKIRERSKPSDILPDHLQLSPEEDMLRRYVALDEEAGRQTWAARQSFQKEEAILRRRLGLPAGAGLRARQKIASKRLHDMHLREKQERLAAWRRKLNDMKGYVYRWVRGAAHSAVEVLSGFWKDHFSSMTGGADPQAFLREYAAEIDFMKVRLAQGHGRLPLDARSAIEECRFSAPSIYELRRALKPMRGKSAGVDLWSAEEILALPDAALLELADMCLYAEETQFPQAMVRWRQVHIPKDTEKDPQLDRFRPIAIASVAWRFWMRFRTRQIMDYIIPVFHPCQAGGIPRRTLESLLDGILDRIEQALADKDGQVYVRLWDFQAAFDSVSPALLAELWCALGVDECA
ncbi:unnamed protein product, partial [Prorocentrum cordatum]